MKRLCAIAVLVLVAALLPADLLAQGCAMCKAVVQNNDGASGGPAGGSSIGAGLNKGIILLMVVPYILLFVAFRKRILGFWREFSQAQG
jgi:hypothetical protein